MSKKYDRETDKYVDVRKRMNVYAVRDDKNGYPHFLVFENKEWKYISAKHFVADD